MNQKILLAAMIIVTLGLFSACDKDKTPLTIPASYDATSFAANTTIQNGLRGQLEALVVEIKKGRTTGTVVTNEALESLFSGTSNGLSSITTPYYRAEIEGVGSFLEELSKASGNIYSPGAPVGQGGTFGGYLFDENGLEMEQMIEKGLLGAAFYNHAVQLMKGEITPATVDQLVSIFGAHPDFPNTPTASKATNPDKFMANYAARRDKNDGQGLYSQLKKAFIELQAAVKAGEDYNEERDNALENIQLLWEKVNSATVINYCHSITSTMSATTVTDADRAKALHAYGECVGFLHGWRTIENGYKQLNDTEIDALLTLLNAAPGTTPTSYKFVTSPVSELPKIQQVITTLQAKFAFTNSEIENFKKNWVAEQGR